MRERVSENMSSNKNLSVDEKFIDEKSRKHLKRERTNEQENNSNNNNNKWLYEPPDFRYYTKREKKSRRK